MRLEKNKTFLGYLRLITRGKKAIFFKRFLGGLKGEILAIFFLLSGYTSAPVV